MSNRILLVALAVVPLAAAAGSYPDLASAYAELHFDPRAPGNVVAVTFSDTHMNMNPSAYTTNLPVVLTDAINAMDPPPERIMVTGDITTTYCNVPGYIPKGDWYKRDLTNECQCWLQAVTAITNVPQENILWIPGNHDCVYTETNAELFCLLTGQPPHHTFDLGGVRFIMYNGGNHADPSDVEKAWVREQVAAADPNRPLAIMVHQPPFNGTATDRGNALFLRDLFSSWPSRWYVFAGHGHFQQLQVVNVGKSNVAAYYVGAASTNAPGGQTLSTGFRILCLNNGLIGTIYFHVLNKSYEVERQPDWAHPRSYIGPFETAQGLLWRRLKTEGTAPEVLDFSGGIDSVEWYAYPTNLLWRFSPALHKNEPTHFLLLSMGLDPASTLDFSTNQTDWTHSAPPAFHDSVYSYVIPNDMRVSSNLYTRFRCYPGPNNFIAGWGLSTTNPPPYVQYPQLDAIAPLEVDAGDTVQFTNVVIDPYAPPDKLTMRLLSAPQGTQFDPATGVIRWQAPTNASGQATFAVTVSDPGTPVLSATHQVSIRIRQPWSASLGSTQWRYGRYSFDVSAKTGANYSVWGSTNLVDWSLLMRTNPVFATFEFVDPEPAIYARRFYRVQTDW